MSKMKKGEKTKRSLMRATKKELREVGYLNASIKGIAARAGVPPSLFSYHYKNLDSIIDIIVRDHHVAIWDALTKLAIEDPLIMLFANDLLVNITTNSSLESRRFKNETSLSHKVSMYAIQSTQNSTAIEDSYYVSILEKHGVALPQTMIYHLRMQESAGRRDILLSYYAKDIYNSMSEDEWYKLSVSVSYCTITTLFRFAGIPNQVIDKCFYDAFEYIENINLDELKLL